MNLDDFLNHPPIINNNNQDSDLSKLKYELEEAKKIIQQQKERIMELENKLNNKESNNNDIIESLKNEIKSKDKELNELKLNLNKINNNETNEKFGRQQMMCVYFTSMDQKINFPVPCINTDIFAEVEEKLYKQYPEYRETNNNFIANGTQVLRFKTIAENKIGNGLPVTLIVPS